MDGAQGAVTTNNEYIICERAPSAGLDMERLAHKID